MLLRAEHDVLGPTVCTSLATCFMRSPAYTTCSLRTTIALQSSLAFTGEACGRSIEYRPSVTLPLNEVLHALASFERQTSGVKLKVFRYSDTSDDVPILYLPGQRAHSMKLSIYSLLRLSADVCS